MCDNGRFQRFRARVPWQQIWRVVAIAYQGYWHSGTALLAAAIAFYCLICLGPLGVLWAALVRHVINGAIIDPEAYRALEAFVQERAGNAADQIMWLIDQIVKRPFSWQSSGSLGARLLSLGALLWAGLRLFDVVQVGLGFVWPGRPVRGYVVRKLISLLMLATAGALFVLLMLLLSLRSAALHWLAQMPALEGRLHLPHGALTFGLGAAISALCYFLLYKFMPAQPVATSAALAGALPMAFIWQALSPFFTRFIVVPFFGQLGWMIVFGLWAFLGAQILLIGAQLTAAYEHVFVARRPRAEDKMLVESARRRLHTYLADYDSEAAQLWAEIQAQPEIAAISQDLLEAAPVALSDVEARQKTVHAVVIATERLGLRCARALGVELAALAPLRGHAAIEYVLAALRQTRGLTRIFVIGDKQAPWPAAVTKEAAAFVDEGPDLWHELLHLLRLHKDACPLLLVAAHQPLLCPQTLSDFLSQCDPQADLCFPLLPFTALPLSEKRKLRSAWAVQEGWLLPARLALIRPRVLFEARIFMEPFLAAPRDFGALVAAFGLRTALRLRLGELLPFLRLRAAELVRRISVAIGSDSCQSVPLTDPALAFALDNAAQIRQIENLLETQENGLPNAVNAASGNAQSENTKPGQ